ncbi:hypothetical protein OAG93_00560 [bacterium]|nr:hypothetical protein [bacterium]
MFPIQLGSVLGGMETKKKHRRLRKPLAAHLTLTKEHLLRFIQSKGSCSHFSRFPTDMMQETINLIKNIGTYNERYKAWIESNVKNAERFLKEA